MTPAALFPDLPVQRPPAELACDTHVLEPCRRCGGKGSEGNPFPRWHPRHLDWDPRCRGCEGAGHRLRRLGWSGR
jgi:hypothetical protein